MQVTPERPLGAEDQRRPGRHRHPGDGRELGGDLAGLLADQRDADLAENDLDRSRGSVLIRHVNVLGQDGEEHGT